MYQHECLRCGPFETYTEWPDICPKCKRYAWDTKDGNGVPALLKLTPRFEKSRDVWGKFAG